MSDPDIGTLSVRCSVEERRLLEDFAHISGVTVEELIREALFLPPLEPRGRHLRVVRGAEAQSPTPIPALRAAGPVRPGRAQGAPRSAAGPAAARSD
jgi:hypothetical protein